MEIKRIEELAGQVTAQHAEQQAAYGAERAAEAAVLEAALAAARPAARALASRLVREEVSRWTDDKTSTYEETTYHELRGAIIAGARKAERDVPRNNRGSYEGSALVLLEDGRLADLAWSGSWSKWQGEGSRVASELRVYGSPAEAIADGWDAEDAVAGLATALERQAAGKAPERAKAARERAERLASVARLMK
jgi:hypothetical protein